MNKAVSFIPIIVIGIIFATYVATTPQPASTIGNDTMVVAPIQANTVDNWKFSVNETQVQDTIYISANLTYIGSSSANYTFGSPLVLNQISAANGTLVWSEITTDLLRLTLVTPGQTFSDSTQFSISQLAANQQYMLTVYPQLNGSNVSREDLAINYTIST